MAEAAESISVVAEEVRVDRTDPHPLLLGETAERPVVVPRVPRAAPREPVHERRVGDALPGVPRSTRPWVHVEAGARVAVPPRRGLDLELTKAREDLVLAHRASV